MIIIIPGEPVAQGRPRFSTRGGVMRAFDPPESRAYKEMVKLYARFVMGNKPIMEGPLSLSVKVFRSVPPSWSDKRRNMALAGEILPTTKPDLENYCKGATDACEGVVFKNDSQIVAHHEPFGKWYSDKPRIEIEIKEIDNGVEINSENRI